MHEALLLMKFMQTKPQRENKITNYYDFCYTVFLNLSDDGVEN